MLLAGRTSVGTTTVLIVLCLLANANLCKCERGKHVAKVRSSSVSSSCESAKTCEECDAQFLTFFGNMTGNFRGITEDSVNKSILEVGRLHCNNLITGADCYNDCNCNDGAQYTSDVLEVATYASILCRDPSCKTSFFMGCYADNGAILYSGLTFSATACDANRGTVSESISQCLEYYEGIQNCTGMCTPGQRTVKYAKLAQEIACKIPATSTACYDDVQTCILQSYGVLGAKFRTGDSFTAARSKVFCRMGSGFAQCLTNTIKCTSALENATCYSHIEDIQHIISLNDAIFKPFCENPWKSFNSVCHL